jgi:hypothetical protein
MRFWPSLSWPSSPEAPPEELRWKQQVSLRPTRALEPAAKAARVMKFFIVVAFQQMWRVCGEIANEHNALQKMRDGEILN